MDIGSLPNLLSFRLNSVQQNNISNEDIQRLLLAAPHLKELSFSGCYRCINPFQHLPDGYLADLEEIDLSDSSITYAALEKLSKVAPNIKRLKLAKCTKLQGPALSLLFSQLTILDLSGAAIDDADLQVFLLASPDLKILNLSQCSNLRAPFQGLKDNQLFYLEKISLNRTNINSDSVKDLARVAPRLRVLNLESCQETEHFFSALKNNAFESLEEIYFHGDLLTCQSLQKLSAIAPNLKTLKLSNSIIVNSSLIESMDFCFSKIKIIDLHMVNMTDDIMQLILKATPKLRKLSLLLANSAIRPFANLPDACLAHLEELTFSQNVNEDTIKDIFRVAPNLKNVDLASFYDIRDPFSQLSQGSLLSLKYFKMSNAKSLSDQAVHAFLMAAPHLRELNLEGCGGLENPFQALMPGCLPDLEVIDLSFTRVTDEAIAALVKAAPKLKKIILDGCGKIQNPLATVPFARKANLEIQKRIEDRDSQEVNSDIKRERSRISKKELEYRVIPYFPNINPARYRLTAYRLSADKNSLNKIVAAKKIKTQYVEKKQANQIQGKIYVDVADPKTFALPSLMPEEGLVKPEIYNALGEPVHYTCWVEMDEKDNRLCYKIEIDKKEGVGPFWVDFAVELIIDGVFSLALPVELVEFRSQYRNTYDKKNITCHERSCRLYEAWVNHDRTIIPENVYQHIQDMRIIHNHCHDYPEFKLQDGRWYQMDMGGVPTILHKYETPDSPKLQQEVDSIESGSEVFSAESIMDSDGVPAIPAFSLSITKQNTFMDALSLKAQNHLILLDKAQSLVDLYHLLGDQLEVFTDLEDILVESEESLDGVLANPTRLKRRLQVVGEALVICVDIRAMSNIEGKLNDLLDRKIPGLPKNTKVVVIDSHEHGKSSNAYGIDFMRRFCEEGKRQAEASEMALQPALIESLEKVFTESEIVAIDCYHSPYCLENRLVGHFALDESLSRSVWHPGELIQLFTQWQEHPGSMPKKIIFKNPPNTPEFKAFIDLWQGANAIYFADERHSFPCPRLEFTEAPYDWREAVETVLAVLPLPEGVRFSTGLVLSDDSLLDFIDSRYAFESKEKKGMQFLKNHLQEAAGSDDKILRIVLSPDLSQDSLAEFLIEAKKLSVKVLIGEYAPIYALQPFYACLGEKRVIEQTPLMPELARVHFSSSPAKLAESLYQAHKAQMPVMIDASSLQAGELSFMIRSEVEFSLTDAYTEASGILTKLRNQEPVILYGAISAAVRDELIRLAQDPALSAYLLLALPPEEQDFIRHCFPKNLIGDCQYGKVMLEDKPEEVDAAYSLCDMAAFTSPVDCKRLEEVEKVLRHSPWVVLQGPTGVGKTNLVEALIEKEPERFCRDIESWLKSSRDDGILFLDEANLIATLNEDFISRFQNAWKQVPPQFYWDGKFYSLANKKVMLAQNPKEYGNSRKDYDFLTESDATVHFEALPTAYIRDEILKEETDEELKKYILEVYEWIRSKQTLEKILITPRDIKAMVCFLKARIALNPGMGEQSISNCAQDIVVSLGKQCLIHEPKLLAEFTRCFSLKQEIERTLPIDPAGEFVFEPHHLEIFSRLAELITAYRVGIDPGLSGMYLEGLPGVGKTAFFEAALRVLGVKEDECMIVPSLASLSEIEAIFKMASESTPKKIVLFNEINTGVMLEDVLNKNLGRFLLLATGNPKSLFKNRQDLGPAVEARLVKMHCNNHAWITPPVVLPKLIESPVFVKSPAIEPVQSQFWGHYGWKSGVREQRQAASLMVGYGI